MTLKQLILVVKTAAGVALAFLGLVICASLYMIEFTALADSMYQLIALLCFVSSLGFFAWCEKP